VKKERRHIEPIQEKRAVVPLQHGSKREEQSRGKWMKPLD